MPEACAYHNGYLGKMKLNNKLSAYRQKAKSQRESERPELMAKLNPKKASADKMAILDKLMDRDQPIKQKKQLIV